MSENGYRPGPWRLDDLFPTHDAPVIAEAIADLEDKVERFAAQRDELATDMAVGAFYDILESYEDLVRRVMRLRGYAMLAFSENTQDQEAQGFMARMQQLVAEVDNRTMFFSLWWKGLAEEAAARLLEGAGSYRYWLESLRLQSPYTLSEPEEKVINLKDVNGVQALNTLYETITNRYEFALTVDGEEKRLTRGELTVYFRHPDAEVRAAAYKEFFRVFGEDAPVLGQIYQSRVRDWRSENVTLRGYETPIAVRNLANHIPDEVVATLLQVTRENASVFRRFFRLKARWLGMEKLRRYDVYASLEKTERRYEFGEAVDLVLESYRQFAPQVADLARRVLDEQHLDSEVRPGKRSGAFCSTVTPDLTPWVLQSYQGRPEDVATLAHELGHAVHSMLAAHHTALTQHASLPLAETASTFGEMLLIDRLLAQDPDPEVQRTLLFRQMDDAYAVILRQAFFAIFERDAHEAVREGASVDALSELYLENLREQFGDAVDVSDDFREEWVAIPHMYNYPFYVYAYAFGQLLVLSLYQQYRQEGESFKPRYIEILAAGGSAAPEEILEGAGIDMRSSAFWQQGFDVLAELVDQLEELPLPEAEEG